MKIIKLHELLNCITIAYLDIQVINTQPIDIQQELKSFIQVLERNDLIFKNQKLFSFSKDLTIIDILNRDSFYPIVEIFTETMFTWFGKLNKVENFFPVLSAKKHEFCRQDFKFNRILTTEVLSEYRLYGFDIITDDCYNWFIYKAV